MKDDTGVTEMKKRSVVLLFLLIGFGIITTSYAFTVTTISTTVEFVDSPRSNSDREVDTYEAYPLGKHSLYVKVTFLLEDPDSTPDFSVGIIPLKSGGDAILAATSSYKSSINAGTWSSSIPFAEGEEMRFEYSETSFAALSVEVVFEKTNIFTEFTECMIEVQESGTL